MLWPGIFNMLNYIKLLFEWYQIQSSNNLFVLFHFCVRLFVCLFVCLLLVCILRQNRCFLNRYCRIQTLITKLLKKLWTWVFNMLNYITLWFEWYQIHNYNNLFVCFILFAIVCLFICLFIYEVYLTSKPRFFNRYSRFQTLIKKPPSKI